MTSVKTSDQDCARNIVVDLIQVPGVGSKLQFSEIGKHCSRLAAKKAMVHMIVRPIMTQEMMEKVLVTKILVWTSAFPKFPNVKVWKHATFDRKGSRQVW